MKTLDTRKQTGLIFSQEFIPKLLDGTKNMTRRPVNPQPYILADGTWEGNTRPRSGYSSERTLRDMLPIYCPYGQPGDLIWVRETWMYGDYGNNGSRPSERHIFYKADGWDQARFRGWQTAHGKHPPTLWKPSIHMPKWAARIWLEITEVRVERVQNVTGTDFFDEGFDLFDEFRSNWDEKYPGSWDRNDWVWALTFKRVEAPR